MQYKFYNKPCIVLVTVESKLLALQMVSLSLVNWAVHELQNFIALVGFATLVVYPTLAWDVIRKIGVVKSYFSGWFTYHMLFLSFQ